jgi:hypothetical protein
MNTCCKLGLGFYLCSMLINGSAAGRQLPNDLAAKLAAFQSDCGKEAAKADDAQKQAQVDLGRIRTLREIAAPKEASASNLSGATLQMGLDGMDIYLRLFSGEAGNNRDALRVLAEIAENILAGERYIKLDAALQLLERSETTRDSSIKAVGKHFDQVLGILQVARQRNPDSTGASVLDAVDVFIVGQKASNSLIVNQYEQAIKPGTQALREIVDKLAKTGG